MKRSKPSIYLASPVFNKIAENPRVSSHLSRKIANKMLYIEETTQLFISNERFPDPNQIKKTVINHSIDLIGCHLSHTITDEIMIQPSLKAVCTSTAGYNHIKDTGNVLITHTPSILDKAVADFTIALILNNLRNLTELHNSVWSGNWNQDQKWDMDDNLSNTIDSKTLGIVGLGEIGREIVRRLTPWGVKIIYSSRTRKTSFEEEYPNIEYRDTIESVFSEADIVSLHVPLTHETEKLVGETLLKRMKKGALLVNTARGEVLDFSALINLLKQRKISINLALDVFDPEPISKQILQEFKEIARIRPDLRFSFMPHNASSDADTRAKMAVMMLDDLILLSESYSFTDLKDTHLIPAQKVLKEDDIMNFRISEWW